MTENTPKVVLFDIGNVLIQWQPEVFFDALMPRARRKELFRSVGLHAMNERIDLGADFGETVGATARQHPQFHDQIMLWHDRWLDIAAPVIDGSVQLNRTLRQNGVTTALLSNIGQGPFDMAKTRYPFFAEFDHIFLSGPLGMAKPDPKIFAHVETSLAVAPGHLLFADDRCENIAAAKARGWQTHLFSGPAGFAKTLARSSLIDQSAAQAIRA